MSEIAARQRWLRISGALEEQWRIWIGTQPLGVAGAIILLGTLFMTVFAPVLAGDPTYMRFDYRLAPPSAAYPFGTDGFGRDILARIVYGARVEIGVSFASALLGVGAGSIMGILSGFYGGIFDEVVQRVVDALMALPLLVLALGIVAVMGPSVLSIVIAIAVPISAKAARVIRSTVLSTKQNDFVTAARAMGCSNGRILTIHIAPQSFAPFLVVLTVWLSAAILAEAALSYLGFGPAPPFVSWGGMLSVDATPYFRRAPWTAVFPGLAISLLVYGVNMLGDAIRDVTDPRLKNQKVKLDR